MTEFTMTQGAKLPAPDELRPHGAGRAYFPPPVVRPSSVRLVPNTRAPRARRRVVRSRARSPGRQEPPESDPARIACSGGFVLLPGDGCSTARSNESGRVTLAQTCAKVVRA